MRWGRFLWVLALIGTVASGATGITPGAVGRARQLFENGVSLERLGQYQQAADTLTQAMETRALQGEDMARALFDRGVAFDALGSTKRALADYSAALHHAPKLSAALNNRANLYRRQGRLEEAKRDYLAALRCPGGSSQYPYYGLGLIAEQLGDRDTARDYIEKALAVDPSYALAAQSLSNLRSPPAQIAVASSRSQEAPNLRAIRPKVEAERAIPSSTPTDTAKSSTRSAPTKPAVLSRPESSEEEHLNLRRAISDVSERPHVAAAVQVQLGAYRDERSATEAWSIIAASSGTLLAGLQPIIVIADLPGRGRYWRLRTGLADRQSARKLCTNLIAAGQACILAGN